MSPVKVPGGPGPSPDSLTSGNDRNVARARGHLSDAWAQQLGPHLLVHDNPGDSLSVNRRVTTRSVVRGRTVVGIYFSADWCPPCIQFTPLLIALHAAQRAHCAATTRNIPPFEVVLVSRCWDAPATKSYFARMPAPNRFPLFTISVGRLIKSFCPDPSWAYRVNANAIL